MSKESSSRKKKSRSKSQSASKQEAASAYKTNDPESDANLNFSAMIAGMVSSFVLFFGVLGLGAEAPPLPETNPTVISRERLRNEVKRKDSIRENMNLLADLKGTRTNSIDAQMSLIEERIKVSKRIVELKPTDEGDRQVGVSGYIVSHLQLLGLDFQFELGIPKVLEKLKQAYEPYLEDPNPKIAVDAQIAELTYLSVKKIRGEEKESIDGIVEQFSRLMNSYPDDKFVTSKIELHLQMLIKHDQDYGRRVFEAIREKVLESSDSMAGRFQGVSDFALLIEKDFENHFEDRNARRERGRLQLIETCETLLASPGIGIAIVEKVAIVGNWLEQTRRYEEALRIYDALQASVDQGNLVEDVRQRATKLSNSGKKRCGLEGTIVSFRGADWLGQPLNEDDLKERVVAVVFWSKSHPASLRFLDQLSASSRILGNKPLVILAVCRDEYIDSSLPIFEKKSSLIRIVKHLDADGNPNSIHELCPVDFWPHLMLIGFGAEVRNANFEPDVNKLRDEILRLVVEEN